ncbi:transposase [Myroides sp. N17-2]|uniref:transposase n=1 Tax=Myroides sp. N17-2 TaxID=2030799 RepID=UPI00117FDE67|nr:transposase [Myroides sp. N17-2]
MRKKGQTSELPCIKSTTLDQKGIGKEKKVDIRTTKGFMVVASLFLSIRGRINFLQLERYSDRSESGFRVFFERDFDFLSFNIALLKPHLKGKTALAFDPSYISKSGKMTPGAGYFWSGCAAKSKWGLEFNGIAVLDLIRKTAFHLVGFQTVEILEQEKQLEFYARKILENKEELKDVSKFLVADAYFSKYTFIEPMLEAGFQVISRLRKDSVLRHFYTGEQKKGKGRKKMYTNKVDYKDIDKSCARLVRDDKKEKIYTLKAHSKSLKREINIVIVYTRNSKEEFTHKTYFSTDLTLEWDEILEMYRQRFQIEFLYRDAKQFTGLNHCQARSEKKLHFHWNMSLTAINLAKVEHWIALKDQEPNADVPFSMSDIKTHYHNELLLKRFISMFGINSELAKNKRKIDQLLDFGKIGC